MRSARYIRRARSEATERRATKASLSVIRRLLAQSNRRAYASIAVYHKSPIGMLPHLSLYNVVDAHRSLLRRTLLLHL